MAIIHGTCIEIDGIGILLRGASGTGKSDLALRLLDEDNSGAVRLVADDRIILKAVRDEIIATAPANIAGLLEVRGLGVVKISNCPCTVISLVIDLVDADMIERFPDFLQNHIEIEGVRLASLQLFAFEASALAKIKLGAAILRKSDMVSMLNSS